MFFSFPKLVDVPSIRQSDVQSVVNISSSDDSLAAKTSKLENDDMSNAIDDFFNAVPSASSTSNFFAELDCKNCSIFDRRAYVYTFFVLVSQIEPAEGSKILCSTATGYATPTGKVVNGRPLLFISRNEKDQVQFNLCALSVHIAFTIHLCKQSGGIKDRRQNKLPKIGTIF